MLTAKRVHVCLAGIRMCGSTYFWNKNCCNYFTLCRQVLEFQQQFVRPFSTTRFFNCSVQEGDHYKVLGITPQATQTQIKNAFYELSKKYHPDVNKDEGGQARYTQITEAYDILGNFHMRNKYDRLKGKGFGRQDGDDESGSFSWGRTTPKPGTGSRAREGPTRPGGTPFGSYKIYNFDEFYEAHYGSTLHKERVVKARRSMKKEHDAHQKFISTQSTMLYVLFTLTSLLLVYIDSAANKEYVETLRQRQIEKLHFAKKKDRNNDA